MAQKTNAYDEKGHGGPQYQEALDRIKEVVTAGLHHGHCQFSIKSAVGSNRRRELTIDAGLSYKFIIPLDELPD